MTDEAPQGRQFRHVYIDRGDPTADAPRMRTRLGAVLNEHPFNTAICKAADRKLGISTPWTRHATWRELLSEWAISDVLSLVTIAFAEIRVEQIVASSRTYSRRDYASEFLTEVQGIFDEENVHYRLDQHGGVHYKHDRAFAEQVAATVASLTGQRYANASAEFERARTEMLKPQPDGKQALRSVFTAAEAAFKLLFPQERRLTSNAAQKLSGLLGAITGDDDTAKHAATKALDSFKDWVDAVHNYRHEQGSPEPVHPPFVVAQHLFSTGVAHVRWLADLDRAAPAE